MKQLMAVCFLLTSILTIASAETIVPAGSVSGIWGAAGSPYLVEGEIYLPTDERLTIEAGVDVIFQGHYKFNVWGEFHANGTETDSILFSAADTSAGWHGLRLNVVPSNPSRLAYCIVEYGKAIGGGYDEEYGGGLYLLDFNGIIEHSTIRDNYADTYGGGIYLRDSNPTIRYCDILNNAVPTVPGITGTGGGVCCHTGASPTFINCNILDNIANNGGGVSGWIACDPVFENCTFSGNYANFNGGGLNCSYHSEFYLTDCTISENTAGWSGGGIFAEEESEDGAIVINSTIDGNTAGAQGGGILTNFSNAVFRNCTITNNTADNSGGGAYLCRYSPVIDSCVVANNTANVNAGGIYCVIGSANLSNLLISNNTAAILAGGLEIDASNVTVSSCLITNNRSNSANGGGISIHDTSTAVFEYCDIIGNKSYGQDGGGLACDEATVTLSFCNILQNNSEVNGGGVWAMESELYLNACNLVGNIAEGSYGGAINCDQSILYLQSCTFAQNSAYSGGGVANFASELTLINSMMVNHTAGGGIYFENSPDAAVSYSDFNNNAGGNFNGNSTPPELEQLVAVNQNGDSCDVYFNIYLDPDLIDPVWSDCRFCWASPCIDAGDPDPQYNDPDETIADMGASYYDQSMPQRILLTPHGAPLEIPSTGGSFDFTIWLTNIETSAPQIEIWADVTLPTGVVYGPVIGPAYTTIDSGMTVNRLRTQFVPAGAPAGIYHYHAYAVVDADTSFDSFVFVKSIGESGDALSGWKTSGESFGGLSIPEEAWLPDEPIITQNYPNPFNPVTTIRYSLPESQRVSIKVYNLQGATVATLVDGFRDAGIHEVLFDASELSSGIYLYRIQTNTFEAAEKMVVLK